MLFRLPRLAIAAALAFTIGLHWGFLQSVAWMGMVVNYSRDGSFVTAVEKTFDGEHPCALCKVIAKGKKSEKKSEYPPPARSWNFRILLRSLFSARRRTSGRSAGWRRNSSLRTVPRRFRLPY